MMQCELESVSGNLRQVEAIAAAAFAVRRLYYFVIRGTCLIHVLERVCFIQPDRREIVVLVQPLWGKHIRFH